MALPLLAGCTGNFGVVVTADSFGEPSQLDRTGCLHYRGATSTRPVGLGFDQRPRGTPILGGAALLSGLVPRRQKPDDLVQSPNHCRESERRVLAHLMFGMTVLAASQLMRLIVPPI